MQIVLCTAYSDYSWEDIIKKLGENDRLLIMKKPFESIEARQIASALSEKWSLLQGLEQKVHERTCELAHAHEELTLYTSLISQDPPKLTSILYSSSQ